MTQQWKLSGNAENVDWSDIAMAGRAYADNLVGEPAVSKVMHMMADEIERLRSENVCRRRIASEFLRRPYCGENCDDAKNDAIRPQSAAKTTTNEPRNGALSGCETVPDPDSRVWETPCTPHPHATPPQGSVQGEGSCCVSRNAKEPVAWAVRYKHGDTGIVELLRTLEECRHRWANRTTDYWQYEPLYRSPQPTLTDEEREAFKTVIGGFGMWVAQNGLTDDESLRLAVVTLRGLLERLG